MRLHLPRGPKTIHGQIIAIIVFAIMIVVTTGPVLERWVREYEGLDIEAVAERTQAISELLREATPGESQIILVAAQRSGRDMILMPLALSRQFTTTSSKETLWGGCSRLTT